MADRITATSRTRSAIRAANEGELNDARTLLVEALEADREYAPAWLWFAAIAEDESEQLFCLDQAQQIQPERSTELAIQRLRGVEPKAPRELTAFVDPEPPRLVRTFREDAKAHRRRRRIIGWLSLFAVVSVGLAVWAWLAADQREDVYFAVVTNNTSQVGPASGAEVQQAAQWAADSYNDSYRLPGKRIELIQYDDEGNPGRAAEIAREIVENDKVIGVIGHQTSATSEAAAPIYAEAGIPVITPTATADQIGEDNEWFFRTIFDNSEEGQGLADYGIAMLGGGSTAVISSNTSYGRSLADGFVETWTAAGQQVLTRAEVPVDAQGIAREGALAAAVAQVVAAKPTGPIMIATTEPAGIALIKGLRAAGMENLILTGDALAGIGTFQELVAEPNPIKDPSTVFAGTPLTLQGLVGEAVTFYDAFSAELGYEATWEAGLAHDAVDVFAEAIMRSEDAGVGGSLEQRRQGVRDALAAATSPETAFEALTRPIYFDKFGAAVRPVAIEVGEIGSAGDVNVDGSFYQLVEYSPEAGVNLATALADGTAVQVQDRVYTVQRLVNVGININEVTALDVGAGTFEADFFVYFKYPGEDDAVDVYFPNAVKPDLGLGDPVRKAKFDDIQTYALYQVQGQFKSYMNFKDFPFDVQDLQILLGNSTLPSAQIVYAPDPELLATSQAERLISGVDAESTIDNVPNWGADSVTFYPKSIGNTSDLGSPVVNAGPSGVTYSLMATDVTISRDTASFLVKNVLPLALLVIVTFMALWLPFSESARVTFSVTGILTGAVMLNSVTSSLRNVEYTVAIEWAYYAFILLSAIMLALTMYGRYLNEKRRLASLRKLNSFTKIFFGVFVFFTVMAYVVKFG